MKPIAQSAKETLEVVSNGGYVAPSGARVDLAAPIARAIAETIVVRPGEEHHDRSKAQRTLAAFRDRFATR